MSDEIILERIITILSPMTEVEEITAESELLDDLELSSIDVFTMLATLEDEFHIRIPEKLVRRMVTVEDVQDVVLQLMAELK